ncbi:MAG: type II toxin-antitoxin system prevent-host-death family antitoxin [Chloroflexota bacterium]|nr:type II toxin-antitoxin system prevent-host-death family antitoxin [Chloroflexota bacterium]MDE2920443.1 type II toxin-antitoxin system prevent-host-death family antitoxin [Chloroflexota bacterium]
MQIDIRQAATQLCKLGELAWQGEEVVIARDGEPYLYLLPCRGAATPRRPGGWEDRVGMAPDFDEDAAGRDR